MGVQERHVLEALTLWKESAMSPTMGPRYLELLVRALTVYGVSTEASATGGDALLRNVWLTVYERHCAGTSIGAMELDLLVELFAKDRWRALFQNAESANVLVLMATKFIETNTAHRTKIYGTTVLLSFATAMFEWLPPGADVGSATLRDIAAALFGEPWCSIVADSRSGSVAMAELISISVPEFLPGRLASPTPQEYTVLPEMTYQC
jgi:hypothetical protein